MAASRAWRNGLRTFIALEQPITQELIKSHPVIQVSTLPACMQLYRACGAHQASLNTWQVQPLSWAAPPADVSLTSALSENFCLNLQEGMAYHNETYGYSKNWRTAMHRKAGDRRSARHWGPAIGLVHHAEAGPCNMPGHAAGPHSLPL